MFECPLRLLLIVGKSRIFGGARDMAWAMIERIVQSPHKVAMIVAEADDPLFLAAAQRGIATLPLPTALRGTPAQIKAANTRGELIEWLEKLREFNVDCGISFYSGYIPLPLIQLPSSGFFLNLHPSPLPLFSGYEAEKFHVITDRRQSCGTIHQLDENFDTGAIFARGTEVELPAAMTSMEVYELIIEACFAPLVDLLDKIAASVTLAEIPPDKTLRQSASRKNAFRETVIRWADDTHRQIDCRLRAFNAEEDEMILKAMIDETLWTVLDVITYRGDFAGSLSRSLNCGAPGERVGSYNDDAQFTNAPIIRTREGLAVLRLGSPCKSCDEPVWLAPEQLLPRLRQTPQFDLQKADFF